MKRRGYTKTQWAELYALLRGPRPTLAPCGFGHDGQCCCDCSLLLMDRPSCDHAGAKRNDPCPEPNGKFVCLAFAEDGFAMTDAREHGCCVMWTGKP